MITFFSSLSLNICKTKPKSVFNVYDVPLTALVMLKKQIKAKGHKVYGFCFHMRITNDHSFNSNQIKNFNLEFFFVFSFFAICHLKWVITFSIAIHSCFCFSLLRWLVLQCNYKWANIHAKLIPIARKFEKRIDETTEIHSLKKWCVKPK